MCTVTYLPVRDNHFILTQNRDEKYSRGIAIPPVRNTIQQAEVIYPTDVDALGTWMSLSASYSCCLLNGGREKHESKPPYKQSRGKLILDFNTFSSVEDFLRGYDFNRIEPFTLIIVEHDERQVHEIVLTDSELQYQRKNAQLPHIWSSVTLYDITAQNFRKYYFNLFTHTKEFNQQNIMQFHQDGFTQDVAEGFIIDREIGVKTVSVSSILKQEQSSFTYIDLINKKHHTLEL